MHDGLGQQKPCARFVPHLLTVINRPPNSPDFAPTDFFLFPKLNVAPKGQCFDDVKTINSEECDSCFKHNFKDFTHLSNSGTGDLKCV